VVDGIPLQENDRVLATHSGKPYVLTYLVTHDVVGQFSDEVMALANSAPRLDDDVPWESGSLPLLMLLLEYVERHNISLPCQRLAGWWREGRITKFDHHGSGSMTIYDHFVTYRDRQGSALNPSTLYSILESVNAKRILQVRRGSLGTIHHLALRYSREIALSPASEQRIWFMLISTAITNCTNMRLLLAPVRINNGAERSIVGLLADAHHRVPNESLLLDMIELILSRYRTDSNNNPLLISETVAVLRTLDNPRSAQRARASALLTNAVSLHTATLQSQSRLLHDLVKRSDYRQQHGALYDALLRIDDPEQVLALLNDPQTVAIEPLIGRLGDLIPSQSAQRAALGRLTRREPLEELDRFYTSRSPPTPARNIVPPQQSIVGKDAAVQQLIEAPLTTIAELHDALNRAVHLATTSPSAYSQPMIVPLESEKSTVLQYMLRRFAAAQHLLSPADGQSSRSLASIITAVTQHSSSSILSAVGELLVIAGVQREDSPLRRSAYSAITTAIAHEQPGTTALRLIFAHAMRVSVPVPELATLIQYASRAVDHLPRSELQLRNELIGMCGSLNELEIVPSLYVVNSYVVRLIVLLQKNWIMHAILGRNLHLDAANRCFMRVASESGSVAPFIDDLKRMGVDAGWRSTGSPVDADAPVYMNMGLQMASSGRIPHLTNVNMAQSLLRHMCKEDYRELSPVTILAIVFILKRICALYTRELIGYAHRSGTTHHITDLLLRWRQLYGEDDATAAVTSYVNWLLRA
jgi:hypothetical protein